MRQCQSETASFVDRRAQTIPADWSSSWSRCTIIDSTSASALASSTGRLLPSSSPPSFVCRTSKSLRPRRRLDDADAVVAATQLTLKRIDVSLAECVVCAAAVAVRLRDRQTPPTASR